MAPVGSLADRVSRVLDDRQRAARLGAVAVFLVVVVIVTITVDVPSLHDLREDFDGTGLLGCVGFALLYAALSLLPVPATIFTLAAGAVFGIARGLPIAIGGATLGAVTAFGIGRLLGRDLVQRATHARLTSMDDLLARRGFVAVLTLRLIPVVPFAPANYLCGATALRLPTYALATALGIVPSCSVYVVVGSYGDDPGSLPFLVALLVMLVLLVGGGVLARRRVSTAARPGRPAGSSTRSGS